MNGDTEPMRYLYILQPVWLHTELQMYEIRVCLLMIIIELEAKN